jgi:hypothetical protein
LKKELEDVERKVSAYRILRAKALAGDIRETELSMLISKNLERRVKSTKKPTRLKLEKIPNNNSCVIPSLLHMSYTPIETRAAPSPAIFHQYPTPFYLDDQPPSVNLNLQSPCNFPPPAFANIAAIFNGIEPDDDYSTPLMQNRCPVDNSYEKPPAIFSMQASQQKDPMNSLDELVDRIMKEAEIDNRGKEISDSSVCLIEHDEIYTKVSNMDTSTKKKIQMNGSKADKPSKKQAQIKAHKDENGDYRLDGPRRRSYFGNLISFLTR